MHVKSLLFGLLCGALSIWHGAAVADDLSEGQETYRFFCSHCHDGGGGHPGTQMLEAKKGVEKSVIKEQQLPAAYIRTVVRRGLLEMAPFRPTEFDDEALEKLIKYLRSEKP